MPKGKGRVLKGLYQLFWKPGSLGYIFPEKSQGIFWTKQPQKPAKIHTGCLAKN